MSITKAKGYTKLSMKDRAELRKFERYMNRVSEMIEECPHPPNHLARVLIQQKCYEEIYG